MQSINTDGFVIVRAEAHHLPEMAAAERLCFGDGAWSEAMLCDALADPVTSVWAAVRGDRLIGYCHASQVVDEGEILNVAVLPDERRSGVGSALLGYVLAELGKNGVGAVYLEVRESNIGARSLYGKFGFAEIALRRRYYTSPVEDAVIMRCELAPREGKV